MNGNTFTKSILLIFILSILLIINAAGDDLKDNMDEAQLKEAIKKDGVPERIIKEFLESSVNVATNGTFYRTAALQLFYQLYKNGFLIREARKMALTIIQESVNTGKLDSKNINNYKQKLVKNIRIRLKEELKQKNRIAQELEEFKKNNHKDRIRSGPSNGKKENGNDKKAF